MKQQNNLNYKIKAIRVPLFIPAQRLPAAVRSKGKPAGAWEIDEREK